MRRAGDFVRLIGSVGQSLRRRRRERRDHAVANAIARDDQARYVEAVVRRDERPPRFPEPAVTTRSTLRPHPGRVRLRADRAIRTAMELTSLPYASVASGAGIDLPDGVGWLCRMRTGSVQPACEVTVVAERSVAIGPPLAPQPLVEDCAGHAEFPTVRCTTAIDVIDG
jgi:hypothetical protein